MSGHDFFIAGRWRDRDRVRSVVDTVRASGRTAYCFIDHAYGGDLGAVAPGHGDPARFVEFTEALAQDDPVIRQIFEADLAAQRAADRFLLVLPAGIAGHIEAGISFGLGKPCFAVGVPDKTETLYCVFTRMFADLEALARWLRTA